MGDQEQEVPAAWPDRIALFLLQLGVSLILLSRGWLTWKWDSPIREIIWEEQWWTPILAKFEVTWDHFALTSDTWITPTLKWIGISLMVLAALPWLAMFQRLRWTRWLLIPAFLILALDAFSRWSVNMHTGMAMEYALRVFAPLALLIMLKKDALHSRVRRGIAFWMLLMATAVTFTGHGLYAMGYYDIPLNFRIMTSEIVPVSEATVLFLLKTAGWLDFVVVAFVLIPPAPKRQPASLTYSVLYFGLLVVAAVLLRPELTGWLVFMTIALIAIPFIPKARLIGLVYMLLWGGATTAARIWAYYDPSLPKNGLDPWLAEALVRTPHWLIPLWLILMMRKRVESPLAELPEKSTEQPSTKVQAAWDQISNKAPSGGLGS